MSDDGDGARTGTDGARFVGSDSPSLVVRAVYFLLVGWWATGIWLSVAWLLNVTVVLAPLGIKMINYTPLVLSLKARSVENELITADGEVTLDRRDREQYPLPVRAVYFVVVGWWLSGVWTAIAWLLSVTIVGLPLTVWMYGKLPFVVSLYRY
jgi:uncharacterized membrane protein YccF (DUF307 family)